MTVEIVGWALIHSLWQGALIAALLGLSLRALRKAPAAWRHWLCFIAMLALFIAPVVTSMQAARTASAEVAAEPVKAEGGSAASVSANDNIPASTFNPLPTQTDAANIQPSRQIDFTRYLPWLVVIWAIGVMLLSLRVLGGYVWARRLVRVGTVPVSDAIAEVAQRLAERLHVRAAVRVLASTHAQVPMVIGFLKPVVLMPASLLTGLTPQQIEAILAHELAHVRRYDYALNVLQTIAETLMFYHPAMWWLSRRMRDEREQACDELAVALCGGDPYFYSRVLLKVEEWRSARITFAPAATGGSLSARVRKLIGEDDRRVDVGPRWFAGIVTIVALLTTAGSAREDLSAGTPNPVAILQDTARARPASVAKYSGNADLSERIKWAHATANDKRFRQYWVGYTISDAVPGSEWVYIDRDSPVMAGDTWVSGRMRFGGDFQNVKFSGVSLRDIVGDYAPRQHTVLLAFDGSARQPRLMRVHMANFVFPAHFNGMPLLWLNEVEGRASIAALADMKDQASNQDVLGDLPAAIGAHANNLAALPLLLRWANETQEPYDFRSEVLEALAQHESAEALVTIARIARRDRSEQLRNDAVEVLAQLPLPAAADTLLALARTLEPKQLRMEAVEALGERHEPRIASWLDELARTGDTDIRSEAVESLAQMPAELGLEKLVALADDPRVEGSTRLEALEEMGNVQSPKALEMLRRIIFEDQNVSMQIKATEAVGNITEAQAVEVLAKIAEAHSEVAVQIEATEELGNMAQHARAIEALEQIIERHPQNGVRIKAIETLGDFPEAKAARVLMQIIESNAAEDLRAEAAETLGDLPATSEMLQFIEKTLDNSNVSVRVKIELLEALDDFGNNAGVPLLRKAARSTNLDVRSRALELLEDR
jgi:beta-lactamase regulating signal transducer with metallopeptidase domain/HEAT repeat protein